MPNDNLRLFCWHSTFAFATPNDFLTTHTYRRICDIAEDTDDGMIAIQFNVALLTLELYWQLSADEAGYALIKTIGLQ